MREPYSCWGRLVRVCAVVCAGVLISAAANLDTHQVVLDGDGKLIPWTPNPSNGYDTVIALSWKLLIEDTPNDPQNGLPVAYTHSEYDPGSLAGSSWPNNPAGKNAMLADSALHYYAYSGDSQVIDLVTGLLDHQLSNGTTPASFTWPSVPWSTAAAGSVTYGNDGQVEGVGVLEPDKVGELGYHGYLMFYELTGNTNYLAAAISCADALATHVQDGDSTRSPWPFRVNAETGSSSQRFCSHVIAPIRLFDELVRLGLGDTNAYQVARQKAWNWLVSYAIPARDWVSYFEDNGFDRSNFNQYAPGQTARYLLEHPELDSAWFDRVTNLVNYIEDEFGGTDSGEPGLQYGARVISEQSGYRYKMASHTARYAAVNALLYHRTGDLVAQEKAYRSLNWATYMCRANGVVIEGPTEYAHRSACWFTDGHGDYVRHFLLAMGAVPEWAPADENHILQCSSVIQSVTYFPDGARVRYRTFDAEATTTMRLAFSPVLVLVDDQRLLPRGDLSEPGWVYDPTAGVLRVRHADGNTIDVTGKAAVAPDFAEVLENGSSSVGTFDGDAGSEHFYRFSVADSAVRLQFELFDCTADLTLVASRGLPPPSLGAFDYQSANPGTNDELILVLPDSQPEPPSAGDWYLTVVNTSGSPASYDIRATQAPVTGQPLRLNRPALAGGLFQLSWNSLPGARYVVGSSSHAGIDTWADISPTLTATGLVTAYAVPVSQAAEVFRIREGVAMNPDSPAQFIVEDIRVQASEVILEWPAPVTLRFGVEWSSTLPPSWNSVPGVLYSTNGWFRFVDDGSMTAPLTEARFYRLVQAP